MNHDVLTANDVDDDEPALSPDGSTIAFTRSDGQGRGVHTMTAAGTNESQLVADGYGPSFSPDGTKIAYTDTSRNFFRGAAVMNADGSNQRVVSGKRQNAAADEFAPNSGALAYTETLQLPGEDPVFQVFTASLDGTKRAEITGPGVPYGDWQPLTAPAPTPALTVELKGRKGRAGKPPKAKAYCSNECELIVRAKGSAGSKRIRSKATRHLLGNYGRMIEVLKPSVFEDVAGRNGKVTVKVRATDDFGQKASAKTVATLKK
jgi:hypothetical protein